MSTQGALKRYHIILEALKHNNYPFFDRIADRMHEESFVLSVRIRQRNIDAIHRGFKVPKQYSWAINGYNGL